MDLTNILNTLKNCPCGKNHSVYTKHVEISSGATAKVGELLCRFGFGSKLLLVADENTLAAAEKHGLCANLNASGFELKRLIYKNMLYARVEQLREIESLAEDVAFLPRTGYHRRKIHVKSRRRYTHERMGSWAL